MLDLARVGAGTRVIDIAAGSGGQSLAAARRGAIVLATDISSNILDEAAAAARAAGVSTVATRVMDGESLDVEPGSFDAAISRLGLMYLPDKLGALAQAERRAAAGRPLCRNRLRRGRPEPVLLGADLDHPPKRRAAAAGPGRAGAVLATNLGELARRRGLPGRRGAPSRGAPPARHGRRMHTARTGVVRRAAPDARRASTSPRARRPGPRSRLRCGSSRPPVSSAAPANCWWAQGRTESDRAASWARDSLVQACT